MFTTLSEVVESYRTFLLHHQASYPKQQALKRFDARLASHQEGATAEAACFEYLRSNRLDPRLLEDASSGGADFLCQFGEEEVMVEVTALGNAAVTSKSGISHELDEIGAAFFDMQAMTAMLRSRASNKARQVSSHEGPRVLVIASEHPGAAVAFSQIGAEEFMTGGASITFHVGPQGATDEMHMSTALSEAAFIRRAKTGGIEPCRRNYSAIMLMALHGRGAHILGLLHPEPIHRLPRGIFRHVPYARISWPVTNNEIAIEWVIDDPQPAQHHFLGIELTGEELRRGL
jgi:hypothetical protein